MTNHPNRRIKRIAVNVDSEVIESSKARDSSHCMIAEAIRKEHPEFNFISVDLQTIRLSNPTVRERYTYLTPRQAQIALIDFDQGNTPHPFTFALLHPQITRMAPKRSVETRQERKAQKGSEAVGGKAQMVGGSDRHPVQIVGGKPPPTTPFARRRAFGLRALDR